MYVCFFEKKKKKNKKKRDFFNSWITLSSVAVTGLIAIGKSVFRYVLAVRATVKGN